ncbi:hypothetical protein [Methanosphaera sp.]|uniref:hypothetical protein n=1 Tax=Methanosphaera sp. TaxID=2666342 RepID=UPI003D919A53
MTATTIEKPTLEIISDEGKKELIGISKEYYSLFASFNKCKNDKGEGYITEDIKQELISSFFKRIYDAIYYYLDKEILTIIEDDITKIIEYNSLFDDGVNMYMPTENLAIENVDLFIEFIRLYVQYLTLKEKKEDEDE